MSLFDDFGINPDININFDPDSFANELIAGADIDEASKAALLATIKNPAVARNLKDRVALRSAAQSAIDRARNVYTEADRIRAANFEWARDNRAALEEFATTRGGGRSTVTGPTGDVMTKTEVLALLKSELESERTKMAEALTKRLDAQDESYVGLITDTQELVVEYGGLFPGEALPYKELQQFALGKRMSLRNAFPLFIQPKLEEKRTADLKRIETEAYERGLQEGLTKREDPTIADEGGDVTTAFRDNLFGRRRTQTLTGGDGKPLEGEDAFVASWHKERGFTQTKKDH